MAKAWVMDPYMQYFTGEAHLRRDFPCGPGDFVHFRKRIGQEGVGLISARSVALHGGKGRSKIQMPDTAAEEDTATFPTDAKPAGKITDKCNSHKRASERLLRGAHGAKGPKRGKRAKGAREGQDHLRKVPRGAPSLTAGTAALPLSRRARPF